MSLAIIKLIFAQQIAHRLLLRWIKDENATELMKKSFKISFSHLRRSNRKRELSACEVIIWKMLFHAEIISRIWGIVHRPPRRSFIAEANFNPIKSVDVCYWNVFIFRLITLINFPVKTIFANLLQRIMKWKWWEELFDRFFHSLAGLVSTVFVELIS